MASKTGPAAASASDGAIAGCHHQVADAHDPHRRPAIASMAQARRLRITRDCRRREGFLASRLGIIFSSPEDRAFVALCCNRCGLTEDWREEAAKLERPDRMSGSAAGYSLGSIQDRQERLASKGARPPFGVCLNGCRPNSSDFPHRMEGMT